MATSVFAGIPCDDVCCSRVPANRVASGRLSVSLLSAVPVVGAAGRPAVPTISLGASSQVSKADGDACRGAAYLDPAAGIGVGARSAAAGGAVSVRARISGDARDADARDPYHGCAGDGGAGA